VRAILPNYGWKICFFILSDQNFHHALGFAAGANWLLSKTGVFPECPGNPRFELQIGNIPHGKRILSIVIVFSWKSDITPRLKLMWLSGRPTL
jgi:hypothetical protein